MGLQNIAAHALRGVTDAIRRNAIGYSICGLCGIAILILATGAAVMALIPIVGAVYAQLIVAGVFLAVIVVTLIWLQRSAVKPARAAPFSDNSLGSKLGATLDSTINATTGTDKAHFAAAQRQMQFAQLAMIIEAVALGYSLSRKR